MSQPLGGANDNAYDHDPGARPIWFGKHEGMRFDELELSYRLVLLRYCEERPAPNLVRFRDHNKKYEDWLQQRADPGKKPDRSQRASPDDPSGFFPEQQCDDEPGATIMWFGTHKGTRLDRLDEGYRRSLLHLSRGSQEPTWVKFRELNEKYMDWLDERRSPMSGVVWFGKYKGHELRVLYRAERRWEWLLKNCGKWRSDLKDMARRYAIWKRKQPPRQYPRRRAPYEIVNRKGECLGPRDDCVASDTSDAYESDDGFVVFDGDELSDEEASDDGDLGYHSDALREDIDYDESSAIGLDHLFDDLADEAYNTKSRRTQVLSPARESNFLNGEDSDEDIIFQSERKVIREPYTYSSSDSDSSLPSLNELFRRRAASIARTPRKPSPTKATPSEASPSKRKLVPRSQLKQSSRIPFTSVERRTTPETPSFSRKRRRPTIDMSDSSIDSDAPLVPLLKRRALNSDKSSILGEDSSEDEPFISPLKSRR